MMTAPAWAASSASGNIPLGPDTSCTQQTELLALLQRQAQDIAAMRYLLAEVSRTVDELKQLSAKAPKSVVPNAGSSAAAGQDAP